MRTERTVMAALLTAALGGLAGCDGTVATGPVETGPVEPGPPVLKLAGNLQASASLIAAWDLDNWAGSSNFVTGLPDVTAARDAILLFRRTDVNLWAWLAAEVDASPSRVRPLVGGRLAFDDQGRLIAASVDRDAASTLPNARLPWTLDFGSTWPTGSGTDGWTQTEAASFSQQRAP
jgi:hypothetical protein